MRKVKAPVDVRTRQKQLIAAVVALTAGVLCNLEAWTAGGNTYDLWVLYVRSWIAAPIVGVCLWRYRLLAAVCFAAPSSILRLMRFTTSEMLMQNLGPMVVMFELVAGIGVCALVLFAGYVTSKLVHDKSKRSEMSK